MIVSLPIGDKGVGLFVHDVMGNFPILKVLSAFPKNAVSFMFNSNCCYDEEIVLADCTMNNLAPQSGIDVLAEDAANSIQEQNVGFVDNNVDIEVSIPHIMSYVQVDTSQNVDLGDFLKRPVQIYDQSWQIGTYLTASTSSFNPWYEFFNHSAIKKKLDNYYLLRCNLHLKFVINASPFYYGCCLVAYQPLTSFNPSLIFPDSFRNENVNLSQRPHIYLYPQNGQGGEMVLPFLLHKNWLDATDLIDLTSMGTIDLQSLTTLANANGLTTDTINIKVYAWAQDLELAGPTVKLALQAGKDEYGKGIVSRPASAIARAAGSLGKLPIIGPFATATSYAAGAVADIASLFGYTDVPVIADVHAFRSKAYPNMAATDIGTPVEKLTLDAKNEVSIDPKICGADINDELIIADFCGRESYYYQSTWTAAMPTNTGLFFAQVSPHTDARSTITGGQYVYSTPMSHVAKCFSYWRGDIKFRFKFICSKYHRGRVRISWDPKGNIGVIGDYTTQTYTRIVDITEETEVEIIVPYTQPTAYLNCSTITTATAAVANTTVANIGNTFNGTLTMRVLNEQTSPVSSADITVLVFVSACDNIEFAGPRQISNRFSPYAPQSGVQFDIETPEHQMGLSPSVADSNINLVYMGEHCASLRQLMRRSVAYKRVSSNLNTTTEYFNTMKVVLGRAPQYPGFDPTGYDTAVGITSGVSEPYNWASWNYATWFSQCFVGSRGSYNYTINPSHLEDINSISVARQKLARTTYVTVASDLPITNQTDYVRRFADSGGYSTGSSGMMLCSQKNQSGAMVSIPMYSRYKFLTNNTTTRTDGDDIDESTTDSFEITTVSTSEAGINTKFLGVDIYGSIGTDFSLIFFLNVPVIHWYNVLPAAV